MTGDLIRTQILSVQQLPNADAALLSRLNVPEGHRSLGLITTNCDDASYAALDEATKKARVRVVYARSMTPDDARRYGAKDGEHVRVRLSTGRPVTMDDVLVRVKPNFALAMYAPGGAGMFPVPVAGVVSKIDGATGEQRKNARELLELTGARPIFEVSAVTGEGVDALLEFLETPVNRTEREQSQ